MPWTRHRQKNASILNNEEVSSWTKCDQLKLVALYDTNDKDEICKGYNIT